CISTFHSISKAGLVTGMCVATSQICGGGAPVPPTCVIIHVPRFPDRQLSTTALEHHESHFISSRPCHAKLPICNRLDESVFRLIMTARKQTNQRSVLQFKPRRWRALIGRR